jgi:hypothetical protein
MITPVEVLKIAVQSGACALRVALPGRVVRVKASGRVDVEIQLRVGRPVQDEKMQFDNPPQLLDVPVIWPSTQAAAIVMKLQPGDPGQVLFNDHALGAWLTAGDLVSPAVNEVHGYSGATFTPGLWPGDEGYEPVADGLRIEVREGARLDMAGDLAQFTAGGSAAFLALKADVDSVKAQVDNVQLKLNAHTHGGFAPALVPPESSLTSSTVNGTTVLKSE